MVYNKDVMSILLEKLMMENKDYISYDKTSEDQE